MRYYNEGQFEGIVKFVEIEPDALILGGPADANEAQCFAKHWPNAKIIACEPNPEAREWQHKEGDWPQDAVLLEWGLSDGLSAAELVYEAGKVRNGSMREASVEGNRGNEAATFKWVPTTTIDELDKRFGPFQNAMLWLDIEGFELKALTGAKQMLVEGRVSILNVELLPEDQVQKAAVFDYLWRHGYEHVGNITEVDFVFRRTK